jgi:nitric oxide reductase subunit C
MSKPLIFFSLLSLYFIYGALVYTKGTDSHVRLSPAESVRVKRGKEIFQQYNCIACHQLYGLGGYLGPELTTAWSDPGRGENYIKALLKAGGRRMPVFNFTDQEINALSSYLHYIDSTATTYKNSNR